MKQLIGFVLACLLLAATPLWAAPKQKPQPTRPAAEPTLVVEPACKEHRVDELLRFAQKIAPVAKIGMLREDVAPAATAFVNKVNKENGYPEWTGRVDGVVIVLHDPEAFKQTQLGKEFLPFGVVLAQFDTKDNVAYACDSIIVQKQYKKEFGDLLGIKFDDDDDGSI
jgi:hypothetical protein